MSASAAELDRAHESAMETADHALISSLALERVTMALVGPTPASQVVSIAAQAIPQAGRFIPVQGNALRLMATAEALVGSCDSANRHMAEANRIARDLGRGPDQAFALFDGGWVKEMCGDVAAAEEMLVEAIDLCLSNGDATTLLYARSRLAPLLADLGRNDDVLAVLDRVNLDEATPTTRMRLLASRAKATLDSNPDAARRDIATVLELSETAFTLARIEGLEDAGDVFAALEDRERALDLWRRGLDVALHKENMWMAGRLRQRIAGLDAGLAEELQIRQ